MHEMELRRGKESGEIKEEGAMQVERPFSKEEWMATWRRVVGVRAGVVVSDFYAEAKMHITGNC